MNEDEPDRRAQFCEWFQHNVHKDEFLSKIVWPDEATFNLNDTVNYHNCVYWAPENSHIRVDKAANLPGLTVCRGLSRRVLIGLFFFEGTVTPLCTSAFFRHPFHLPFIISMGMNHFTSSELAHHHTTTDMSEVTSMKPYQVSG
jgi:hypothetical protein